MTTKRPYATNTKKRTYTVTEEDHEALRKLGDGNASAGIRVAVKSAMERAAVRGFFPLGAGAMKNSVWLIEDWAEPFCDSPEYYGVCRTKADAEKELTRLNGLAYRKQLNKWREDQDRISEGGTPFVTAVHPELSFWQPYHAVEVPIIIVG